MTELTDLISPVVIKELRQGLRARAFLYAFFLLPAVLALTTMTSLAFQHITWEDEAHALFWLSAGVPMLIAALPSCLSLRHELRSQAVELMLMTGLSPWRILLGKWAALAAQFALMAIVALPFALVRYFAGGMELVADLRRFGALFGLCEIVAAAALAAVCWRPSAARLIGIGLFALLALPLVGCLGGLAFLLMSSLLARVGLAPLNGLLIALLLLSWAAGRLGGETERIYLNLDRKAFYWALMATLTAQSAGHLASVFLAALSIYFHLLAFRAFVQRREPAAAALLPLIPRRWREDAASEPGVMGLCAFVALAALDFTVVVHGFLPESLLLLGPALLTLYLGAHALPRRAGEEPEVIDAAGT